MDFFFLFKFFDTQVQHKHMYMHMILESLYSCEWKYVFGSGM